MKKFLPVLFIFLFSFASAQTNVYHPFPDSDAVWNIYTEIYGCPYFPFIHAERYSYVFTNDTVIAAATYHKLFRPYVQLLDTCWGQNPVNYAGYAGCIRQDTAARKIFYVPPSASAEQVLYDFSLGLGDTVISYLTSPVFCSPQATTVTARDSVMVNGSYRKRWEWNYEGWYTTSIVEGIGSLNGLLEAACSMIDGPFTRTMCFRQNGTLLYTDPTYTDSVCSIIDAVKNIPETELHLSISPNPFHATATLSCPFRQQCEGQHWELRIFYTMGSLVRAEKILNIKSYLLHRGDLRDGMYFYELRESNSKLYFTGKFIID